MRIMIISALLLIANSASAQFGLRIKAQQNDYTEWNRIIQGIPGYQGNELFQNTYEVGVDYWLRLKNYRLEFYPELSLALSTSSFASTGTEDLPQSYRLEAGGIGLNTHIYFLDFANDCQCPTFSKQNTFFKKGLFMLVGVHQYIQNKETTYRDRSVYDRDYTTQISAGLGLDIGLNDLLTISPFITALYYPRTEWQGINANHGIINVLPPDESTSNLAFQIGIRVGFRPDYLKNPR